MPQVMIRRPFHKFKLPHKHRFQPPALGHLLGGQPLPPSPCVLLGQIRERALAHFQLPEAPEQLLAQTQA